MATKICDMASAVERFNLNPYELGSLVDSDTGSNASRYRACIALSFMVGMPSGRSFPLALGIKTLRKGRGLYPRRSTCRWLPTGCQANPIVRDRLPPFAHLGS